MSLSIVVYEPLVRGANVVESLSYHSNSYSHTIQANGGFDTMSVELAMNRDKIDDWIEQGIGRHVIVYNSANEPCWEGFVNTIEASMGAYSVTVGPLVDSGNRVSAVYSRLDTDLDPPQAGDKTVTPIVEDLRSQQRYGIVEKVINAGRITDEEAELVRDTFLREMAFPSTSSTINIGSANAPTITLSCLGYWYWTNLYVYDHEDDYSEQVDNRIKEILEANPNTGMFGNITIDTNNTILPPEKDDDKTAMSRIRELLALGGAQDQRYTLGVYENRNIYYKEIPKTPDYRTSISDQGQKILTFEGAQVFPWDVRPGRWIFVSDALIGRYTDIDDLYEDPRYIFIESVNYDAPWGITLNGSRTGTFDQMMARLGLGSY